MDSSKKLGRGQSFRASFRTAFRAGSFSSTFASRSKIEPVTSASVTSLVQAGGRTLNVHSDGYTLASDQIFKGIYADELAVRLTGGEDRSIETLMQWRMVENRVTNPVGRMSTRTNTGRLGIVSLGGGRLQIFNIPKKISQPADEATEVETADNWKKNSLVKEFPLSHLYGIKYGRRGAKEFELTFYHKKSPNTSLETPTYDFKLVTLMIRAERAADAEEWIRQLLLATRDLARLVDSFADIMRKGRREVAQAENFLRLAVDLWAIAMGPNHIEVAKAQERLAEHLDELGDVDQEAAFWTDKSEEIKGNQQKRPLSALDELRNEAFSA